jgi:hypothetical protein
MTFHWVDRRYPLNTDIATSIAKTPGGPRAFLTQADKWDNFFKVSYASKQLLSYEKNDSLLT